MIRITALNEVVNIDNNEEYNNALTKEAQEQVAFNEYNRALRLLIENNREEALIVLKELIDTELLNAVRKPHYRDGRSRPMLSLKYSCYKNIAGIEADFKNYHAAIHNYWEAAQLDDSDVMLWYKIGCIAIKIANLEVACLAFNQGLKQNNNHWPCLDHIITVLYAIPDHKNCLYYISMALERDSTYIKGLAFCKEILKNVPELRDSIISFKNRWVVDLLSIQYDKVIADSFIKEAVVLQQKWITMSQIEIINDPSNDLKLSRPLPQLSWLELGKSLTDMYNYIVDNKLNFMCHIWFDSHEHFQQSDLNNIKKYNTMEIETIKMSKEATCLPSSCDEINFSNYLCSQDGLTRHVSAMKAEEKEIPSMVKNTNEILYSKDFEINCSDSQGLDENILIHLNENCSRNISNDKTELSINESRKLNSKLVEQLYENNETSMKYNMKDKVQKVKKRRRSSLCFLTQWAWSSSNTKRSSRARNVGRNNYEKDGLLEETLRRIFPPAFMAENVNLPKEELSKNDDSLDTIDSYCSAVDKENNLADDTKSAEDSKPNSPINDRSSRYFGLEYETFDVSNFIKEYNRNKNIIMLISKFHEFLSTKWNTKWSDELIEVYIQSYLLIRDHLPHFSQVNQNVKNGSLNLDAEKTLLFCELYTDKWLLKKPSIFPMTSSNTLGIGISSDELGYLIFHSTQTELYDENNIIFFLRLLWLQAKIFLYQGEADISIRTLELLIHKIQQFQYNSKKLVIKLKNCRSNSLIAMKTVENLLKFIKRNQKIGEIKFLYQEEKYEELTDILKDSFEMTKHSNPCLRYRETPIDRAEQLRILLDSLWQLEQYEECYVWSEACFNESWHSYLNVTNSTKNNEAINKWIQTILYILEKLNACIAEVSISIAKHLSDSRRLRLVQNLINLVCHQLEVPDHPTVMIIESVLPWLLLHYILQYEEDKHRAKTENTVNINKKRIMINMEFDVEDEDVPSSITILLKAHEFLGRHGWCCINEGQLLIFIMKLLIPQFRSPLYLAIKEKLREPLEQVIYCLYGYPDKNLNSSKLKIKHYDEHVNSHAKLTWEACELLFEFYRPEILPSFESKRVDSINADVAYLFKQMCKLVPQDSNPNQILDELNAYLVGKRSDFPCIRNRLHNSQIGYIYYLIADYYFKAVPNQSWKKAITYYKFDLCLHPNELNSWAGLAMSTSTLMETWLNNFQPNINEEKYLKEAKIAQRSYEQAINLAPSHLTIWTEFGNFLYTVHSFCSRLLKQESDSLSMERFRTIESHKEEMLEEAEKCFTSANRIYTACQGIDEPQDERWLYHYMLAKISEKKNHEPLIFLSHYSKASQLLNENNAQYPKRISHKCPQNLAIEALEIYYRIHASILKYLEQHEGESIKRSLATVFKENLHGCSKSPFILQNTALVSMLKIEKDEPDDKSLNQNTDLGKTALCNEAAKFEGQKRCSELQIDNNVKRMKLNNISHLELMQDVLELIDDLITEVCNNVSHDLAKEDHQYNAEIMIFSKTKEMNRTDPSYSALRNIENAYARESESRDIRTYPVIKNETLKKGVLKRARNEMSEMENNFISKTFEELKENNNPTRNISRRGSQESTTTSHTSTTGNNSTSSSSDDSTSSDDTSCSSSTTNSDSDSNNSDAEKKKVISDQDSSISSEDTAKIIESCLAGLEQCVLRFPEHYKSIYRLAHFFFYNKNYRNINKSKQLLLGTYECQFHKNQVIQGLFVDRKNNNFFNGIWRIPSNEIDRPGSFASHMSRCILLLMQVLKDTGDSKKLIELCLQLRKTPDTDKKYLRDSERKQLSSQALTLCSQSLRNKIKIDKSIKMFDSHQNQQKQVLLDIFYVYQNIKNIPEFESVELPKIRKLLEDAYSSLSANFTMHGNIFEIAIEFCRQTIRGCKTKATSNDVTVNSRLIGANANKMSSSDAEKYIVPNLQVTSQQQRAQKNVSGGRSRGRPSNSPKYIQTMNNTRMAPNQTELKSTISNNSYISLSSNVSNSSSINSYLNEKMLSVMLGSGVNTNMLEYLSQVEKYQHAVKQYQNNLNMNSSSEVHYCKKETNRQLPYQILSNISTVENCLSSVKDRKDISITPVALSSSNIKPKSVDLLSSHATRNKPTISVSVSKPEQRLQFSSVNQTSCPISKSSLLPITDVQKSLSMHSLSSDILPSNYCTTNTLKDQFTILPSEKHIRSSQKNLSLQHKLLSKKQRQQLYESPQPFDPVKKHKPHRVITSLANSSTAPYAFPTTHSTTEGNSYLNSANTKRFLGSTEKPIRPKISFDTSSAPTVQNINNSFCMFSQLQQQPHLEIIPQSIIGPKTENIFKRSFPEQNQSELSPFVKTDRTSVFELPKQTLTIPSSGAVKLKKQDKSKDNKVEIITLDD